MAQVCSRCSRVNPPEAAYCYHDGALLAGHSANGGPVNQGAQAFPNQFVFPSGQACRNFDQLATACQRNWSEAVDLLKQGFLAGFLGGLGRADLALAAQEAARFPDSDRGLDQLLEKLPTQVLEAPKLKVEPTEISLGQLPMGTDRSIQIHLGNQGMRLLYGSVVSDAKWLTLGEPPGHSQKLVQFGAETTLTVQIRGQHLRAGAKALEGSLVIESNGGAATIRVKADVPVKPFKDGVLAGSISPRQVAEKAKVKAAEAAPLFEKGAVAQWFTDNGWQYPVQGPPASGLGAVQQFFEALGLAKAPKLEVKPASLTLKGKVGETLDVKVEVFSQERRPVYAHGTTDQPWLDVSRAKLNGRFATIPVQVRVPNRPGETLQANIRVTGNGNQRFTVPLTLAVESSPFAFGGGDDLVPVSAAEADVVDVVDAEVVEPAAAGHGTSEEIVETVAAAPTPSRPSAAPPAPSKPAPFVAATAAAPPPASAPTMPAFSAEPFVARTPAGASNDFATVTEAVEAAPAPAPTPRIRRQGFPAWVHLTPLLVLAITLVMVMIRDLLFKTSDIDGYPVLDVKFDVGKSKTGKGMNFGIYQKDVNNPKETIWLTYVSSAGSPPGYTNSVVVAIDPVFEKGIENARTFGDASQGGQWKPEPAELFWGREVPYRLYNVKKGMKGGWLFSVPPILVTQHVERIPGEPVEVTANEFKRKIDTCLVRFRIDNLDTKPHRVDFRFVLDTLIGKNDQPKFMVPGISQLLEKPVDFYQKLPAKAPKKTDWQVVERIPDFIQALEKPDIKNPGNVAMLNLQLPDKFEKPSRVSLTQWPGHEKIGKFDIPMMKEFGGDSAIVIYWSKEEDMAPKSFREMAFTYGVGSLESASDRLKVDIKGDFDSPKGKFSVVALVKEPNQTLELVLPKGLSLIEGEAKQTVKGEEGRLGVVTWQVQSQAEGTYKIDVRSSLPNLSATKTVVIKQRGLF